MVSRCRPHHPSTSLLSISRATGGCTSSSTISKFLARWQTIFKDPTSDYFTMFLRFPLDFSEGEIWLHVKFVETSNSFSKIQRTRTFFVHEKSHMRGSRKKSPRTKSYLRRSPVFAQITSPPTRPAQTRFKNPGAKHRLHCESTLFRG